MPQSFLRQPPRDASARRARKADARLISRLCSRLGIAALALVLSVGGVAPAAWALDIDLPPIGDGGGTDEEPGTGTPGSGTPGTGTEEPGTGETGTGDPGTEEPVGEKPSVPTAPGPTPTSKTTPKPTPTSESNNHDPDSGSDADSDAGSDAGSDSNSDSDSESDFSYHEDEEPTGSDTSAVVTPTPKPTPRSTPTPKLTPTPSPSATTTAPPMLSNMSDVQPVNQGITPIAEPHRSPLAMVALISSLMLTGLLVGGAYFYKKLLLSGRLAQNRLARAWSRR